MLKRLTEPKLRHAQLENHRIFLRLNIEPCVKLSEMVAITALYII